MLFTSGKIMSWLYQAVSIDLRRICQIVVPRWSLGRRNYKEQPRLIEIGKCETLHNKDAPYQQGQLFIHKLFSYRGVILFSWNCRVSVNDALDIKQEQRSSRHSKSADSKSQTSDSTTKPKHYENYYLVLVDVRDAPYKRNQMQAMTFLSSDSGANKQGCYVMQDTDIVNHDDIIPFSSKATKPIHNNFYEYFFVQNQDKENSYEFEDRFLKFQSNNFMPWLDMERVAFRHTKHKIRVTAIPLYLGGHHSTKSPDKNLYTWMYCIRLENLGSETFQLRERYLNKYFNDSLHPVSGQGVNGQEPILSPEQRYFQYVSFVQLPSPRGRLWGHYRMLKLDGTAFECSIPLMELKSDES